MTHEPQPVAPVFQPEAAAAAIVSAIDGPRSRVFGTWNRVVVIGARVAPGVLHRYAARTGFAAQQTGEPADPARPANLFMPVDDTSDQGARGRFSRRAGGALDPSFLRSLPRLLIELARAAADASRALVAGRR